MLKLFETENTFHTEIQCNTGPELINFMGSPMLDLDYGHNFIHLLKQNDSVQIETELWCGPALSQTAANNQLRISWQWRTWRLGKMCPEGYVSL